MRGRCLAHADAAVAAGLVQPRADVEQVGDVSIAYQRFELCRDVGLTSNDTRSFTRRPCTIIAETAKSR